MYAANVCFQMFQQFQTYVASVLSECCIGHTRILQVYVFKYFQLFQTYVASVLFRCCSGHTHMLQAYVLNVSSVFETYVAANATCCKCSISRRGKWAQAEQVVPSGVAVPAGRKKRSEHGGPHVHVEQQPYVYRSSRKASPAGAAGATRRPVW
jgi:hypothetical protein